MLWLLTMLAILHAFAWVMRAWRWPIDPWRECKMLWPFALNAMYWAFQIAHWMGR